MRIRMRVGDVDDQRWKFTFPALATCMAIRGGLCVYVCVAEEEGGE